MLTVEQTQSTDDNVPAIFRLPTQVAVFTNGSTTPTLHDIVVDERSQTFTFPSSVKPDVVIFDPRHDILAQFNYTKTAEELAAQFKGAPTVVDRYLVLQRLGRKEASAAKTKTITLGLEDSFHAVRALALQSLDENITPEQQALVKQLALSDPHSSVRAGAVELLAVMGDEGAEDAATAALKAEPFGVVAAGLEVLSEVNPARAAKEAAALETLDNPNIQSALASIYATSGDVSKLPFFEEKMKAIDGFSAIDLFSGYGVLLGSADADQMAAGIDQLKGMAMNLNESPWRRLASTKTLHEIRESLKETGSAEAQVTMLKGIIDSIKANESMGDLKNIYQQYGN